MRAKSICRATRNSLGGLFIASVSVLGFPLPFPLTPVRELARRTPDRKKEGTPPANRNVTRARRVQQSQRGAARKVLEKR